MRTRTKAWIVVVLFVIVGVIVHTLAVMPAAHHILYP
jgi:hypothetical protein